MCEGQGSGFSSWFSTKPICGVDPEDQEAIKDAILSSFSDLSAFSLHFFCLLSNLGFLILSAVYKKRVRRL